MACRCPSGWGPSWIGRLLSFQFSQIIHTKDVVFTDLMERQLPLFGPSSHSYFPNLQVFRTFPKLHHQCLVPQNLQGFLKGFVKLPGHTAFPAWWRRRRPSLPPAQKVPEYSSVFFLLQWWTGFQAYILLHLQKILDTVALGQEQVNFPPLGPELFSTLGFSGKRI